MFPAVMRSKRMTHPHLYDRMVRSGVTPELSPAGCSAALAGAPWPGNLWSSPPFWE